MALPAERPSAQASEPDDGRARKMRRFSWGVTIAMMILCNAIFLAGVWASGVNLDELMQTPDLFNPKQDICLRLTWERVAGAPEPVRLCSEWINLSDPSGKPHHIQKDFKVTQGPDGKYYYDQAVRADYRLIGFVLFVAAVVVFGIVTKRYLVSRYRVHLDAVDGRHSHVVH